MRKINNIVCIHVKSEPGDATLYDYIVMRDWDNFTIMPYKSTFSFPQRLNYYDAITVKTLEDACTFINERKHLSHINPHTLLEVCITIVKIYNEYECSMGSSS